MKDELIERGYEFDNNSETGLCEVEKIIVYVELDSTNNYRVTFFNAVRK